MWAYAQVLTRLAHGTHGYGRGFSLVGRPLRQPVVTWASTAVTQSRRRACSRCTRAGTSARRTASRRRTASPPDRIVTTTLAGINRAVPHLRAGYAGRAWVDSWVADPHSHGSYAAFRPGQFTRWWGFRRAPGAPRPLRRGAHLDARARVPRRGRRQRAAGRRTRCWPAHLSRVVISLVTAASRPSRSTTATLPSWSVRSTRSPGRRERPWTVSARGGRSRCRRRPRSPPAGRRATAGTARPGSGCRGGAPSARRRGARAAPRPASPGPRARCRRRGRT